MIKNNLNQFLTKYFPFYEFLLLVLFVTIFSIKLTEPFILEYGYIPNKEMIVRLGVYFALGFSLLLIFFRSNKINIPSISNFPIFAFLSLIPFFIFIFVILFYLFGQNYYSFKITEIGLLMYATFYTYIFVDEKLKPYLSNKLLFYVLILLNISFLIYPFYTAGVINNESYFNNTSINKLKDYYKQNYDIDFKTYQIQIGPEASKQFLLNAKLVNSKTFRNNYYLTDNFLEINIFDISPICYLIDNKSKHYSYSDSSQTFEIPIDKKITECINFLENENHIYRNFEVLNKYLSRYNFYDLSIRNHIDLILPDIAVSQSSLVNIDLKNKKDLKNAISIMDTRGVYLHHYNSIAQSINTSQGIIGLSNNQYGLGPLLIVNEFSNIFNTTQFDGIYLATSLVNIFMVLMIFYLVRNFETKTKNIMLFWLVLSISIIHASTGMLAPFLHYIRMLPMFLFLIYIFNLAIKNKEPGKSPIERLFIFLIIILMGLYNFEYAILTAIGLIATAIFVKKWIHAYLGLSLISVATFLKYLGLTVYTPELSTDVRYVAYLAEWEFTHTFDIHLALFWVIYLIIFFKILQFFSKANFSNSTNKYFLMLNFITFGFMLKLIWIGSWNHIGPIFLLVGMLIVLWIKVATRPIIFDKSLNIYPLPFITSIILIFTIFTYVFNLFNVQTNKAFKFESYEANKSISMIQKISVPLSKKINHFKDIYQSGDLVLSQIDNALALAVRNKITVPYPDVSTNINYLIDIKKISKAYLEYLREENKRIIVDKAISQDPVAHKLIFNINSLPFIRNSTSSYIETLSRYKEIFKSIKPKIEICSSTYEFDIYCLPENK